MTVFWLVLSFMLGAGCGMVLTGLACAASAGDAQVYRGDPDDRWDEGVADYTISTDDDGVVLRVVSDPSGPVSPPVSGASSCPPAHAPAGPDPSPRSQA